MTIAFRFGRRRMVGQRLLRWSHGLVGLTLLHQVSLVGVAKAQERSAPDTVDEKRTSTAGMDRMTRVFLLADLLEFAPSPSTNPIRLDAVGWIGGDYNRVWLRAEGQQATVGDGGEIQAEVLYGRIISPFWDAVAGLRVDGRWGGGGGASRVLLSVGVQGLAPYWFEVEPSLFVSQKGHVSARLTTSVDLFFTQRLIAAPRLELNAAVQKVPEFGVGSGLNDLDLGFRLRYEIRREFAPYVGVYWIRRIGGTATLARQAGQDVSEGGVTLGVRTWY